MRRCSSVWCRCGCSTTTSSRKGCGRPIRSACLETALATTLAAAAHRRHTHLVLGARFDPLELHAWTTTGDRIIGEQAELDRELHPVYPL
ncbi:lasso peptide biosynthesis B2 protein [Embleya sp. NPDC050493]|uniref:lasso peptide biosynthesis B2 protein n=1 Tax=Embleya sp. NPDC050493 TaxID=3363989 RepID=UPI0037B4601F